MFSEKLIEKLVNNAEIDDLKVFANAAIKHLLQKKAWNNSINNALELITGIANPYEIKHIDMDKVENYVKTRGYNTENASEIKVICIDNFDCDVTVSYKQNDEEKYDSNITISLSDVAKENI